MGIRVSLYGVLPLNESFAQVRNEGGGFAANIYRAMPESGI